MFFHVLGGCFRQIFPLNTTAKAKTEESVKDNFDKDKEGVC